MDLKFEEVPRKPLASKKEAFESLPDYTLLTDIPSGWQIGGRQFKRGLALFRLDMATGEVSKCLIKGDITMFTNSKYLFKIALDFRNVVELFCEELKKYELGPPRSWYHLKNK